MDKKQILEEISRLEKVIESTWKNTNNFAYMCGESTYRFDGVRRNFTELKRAVSNLKNSVKEMEE